MSRYTRSYHWLLIAAMASPLFATSCVSNASDFFEYSNRKNDDVGAQIDDILDDVGDLVDHIF